MAANTHSLDLEAGSSQYASIADASQTGLDITGNLTIECWVKFETTPGSGSLFGIVSKFNQNSERAYLLALHNDGGTLKLRFVHSTDSDAESAATVDWTPSTGTWYHVAVTFEAASADVKFYVDTAQQGATQNTAANSIANTAAAFALGCFFDGSGNATQFFDGLIDEVAVYNAIADIATLDNQADKSGRANLQGYWKLNNDYEDATANNNDLTATGSPVFSNDAPFANYTGAEETFDEYAYFM